MNLNFRERSYVNSEGIERTVLSADLPVTLESQLNEARPGLYVATVAFENLQGQKVKRAALLHQGMLDYSEAGEEHSRPFLQGEEYLARVDIATALPNEDPNKVAITLTCLKPNGGRASLDDFMPQTAMKTVGA